MQLNRLQKAVSVMLILNRQKSSKMLLPDPHQLDAKAQTTLVWRLACRLKVVLNQSQFHYISLKLLNISSTLKPCWELAVYLWNSKPTLRV
jgi:hypothetical protein